MKLNQPRYIESRYGDNHIDLDKNWCFSWSDHEFKNFDDFEWKYKTDIPKSIYWSLYEAGILPHPYLGENSNKYHWVDEKVWYYRKTFGVNKPDFEGNVFLCFDGVAYYSKLWINGNCVGDHEGMFGGPVVDIVDLINKDGENEIIIEVKSCNYGKKEPYYSWNFNGENKEIVPWNIARDNLTSNGDFIVMGIWNNVRLEFVSKLHISRPYIYTDKLVNNKAYIKFETEIADGRIKEIVPFYGKDDDIYSYTRAFDSGNTGSVTDDCVEIEIVFFNQSNCVYQKKKSVQLTDFEKLGMNSNYYELQYFRDEIIIDNPKLWYPNGMGEPFLYKVEINLYYKDKKVDTHNLDFGIRTFQGDYTKGNKCAVRWEKYLFSVNGEQFFLRGMNWTPIDFLYDINPNEYEWCLNLVKNAGIQLLRVWNGGGMPETDTFYQLCDKMGIMVWQDQYIANTESVKKYPLDILENQIAYNIYRTRNHPSLVILCGGNEFNPYRDEVASAMFVTERTVKTLIPDRIFYYTTSDSGSAHIYIDMEPTWFRHRYKQLPFLAESGIHSFPNYKTIKRLIPEAETSGILPNLSSEEFQNNYKCLLNHFTEYKPDRVPRLTSRMSQIINMNNATLADVCEASQVQAYEFYQIMIQSMLENFPFCGGVMPWVFKRPWPTVGIQTVDGSGLPCLQYYAIQNCYKAVNVCLCLEWSVIAPGENIALIVKILGQSTSEAEGGELCVTVYNPDLSTNVQYCRTIDDTSKTYDFGVFTPPQHYNNKCFLICVDIIKNEKIVSRSTYTIKCSDVLLKKEMFKQYRNFPTENMYFKFGPWLKKDISCAKKAKLILFKENDFFDKKHTHVTLTVKNASKYPAYPVTIETKEDVRFFCSENYFLLKAEESKSVLITIEKPDYNSDFDVSAWNL